MTENKGDLISREALKATIIEPLNVNDACKNDWYEGYYTAKNEDIMAIDNAPTVQSFTLEDMEQSYYKGLEKGLSEWETERPQGKWIPTSEFSPEEYDSYLVMWRFMSGEYDGKLFYEICEYDPDEDEWERIEQAGEAGAEIVAWMPLPERYEPKQDDDTAKDMI